MEKYIDSDGQVLKLNYNKYMKKEQYIDSDGQVLDFRIYDSGNKYYHDSKNQYHRLDGPAIEYPNGYCWVKNGIKHRIGGPAYFQDIYYVWFVYGKRVKIYYICG